MKAFLSGVLLVVVVSVLAWAVLDTVNVSSQDTFTSRSGSVRL